LANLTNFYLTFLNLRLSLQIEGLTLVKVSHLRQ
jgi:hypothetical protein